MDEPIIQDTQNPQYQQNQQYAQNPQYQQYQQNQQYAQNPQYQQYQQNQQYAQNPQYQQYQQNPQYQQYPQNQQYQQYPQYPQNPQPKSKKKLIIILSAAVVLIVGFLLVYFLVLRSNKNMIIGTWKSASDDSVYVTFNKDGTVTDPLDTSGSRVYQYTVDGDTLIIDGKSFRIVELTSNTLVMQVMEYSGMSLTQTFVKQEPDKSVIEKNKMRTANSNAKLVFTTVNNEAADILADGDIALKLLKTPGAVPVSSFKNSSDPLEKAVYDALKDNGEENMGYVYVYYDPNDWDGHNFVQWSESADGGIIGQFPSAPKTPEEACSITFGSYFGSYYD